MRFFWTLSAPEIQLNVVKKIKMIPWVHIISKLVSFFLSLTKQLKILVGSGQQIITKEQVIAF